MHSPKQLLKYRGKGLLEYATDVACQTAIGQVLVVLGAHFELVSEEADPIRTTIVHNENWEEGMASSIRAGINALDRLPAPHSAIIMLCDQPFVQPSLLGALLAAHASTGQPIVASAYKDTFGPPVFFHHSLFPELLKLTGDEGARILISQHPELVTLVSFDQGKFDIDTEEDYEQLLSLYDRN